jgi:hypothetical protein
MALFLKDVDLGTAATATATIGGGGEPYSKVETAAMHVRQEDLHEV